MTTATPIRTLAQVLEERWEAGDHGSLGNRVPADTLGDAIDALFAALVNPYYVYEDDAAEKPVGARWLRELEETIDAAVRYEWNRVIVPAAVAAVIDKLPSAPEYLRVFPGSEQLRADLALLRGSDA